MAETSSYVIIILYRTTTKTKATKIIIHLVHYFLFLETQDILRIVWLILMLILTIVFGVLCYQKSERKKKLKENMANRQL